ncbi:MAG: Rab family GTPase [Candidatus Hermodarchaeota archaeon]
MAFSFKVIIIGQGGTGKTSLCIRATQNTFSFDYKLTIGTGFFTYEVQSLEKPVYLQIWDFAGQNRFYQLLDSFTAGTNGTLLVFDLSDFESVINLEQFWLPFIAKNLPKKPVFLIGTKMDLDRREIEDDLIENLKKRVPNLVFYISTSAKTGENVINLFQRVGKYLVKSSS